MPGPEAVGSEREIKWGQNIPASGEQAKEELKSVSGGAALGQLKAAPWAGGNAMVCGSSLHLEHGRLALLVDWLTLVDWSLAASHPCRRARGWPSLWSRAWECC